MGADQAEGDFYGHRMSDEQAFISVLNELHRDLNQALDDDSGSSDEPVAQFGMKFDDHHVDRESMSSARGLIQTMKLRVRPQYKKAVGHHLEHQESLELGSLT